MVERSAVLPVTCQPFALIFLCQGQRGRSLLLLFFEAMGAMVEYSISHQILFSKLNYCAQMADLVTPAQGLLLVMVVILSKLLSLFLRASLLFFFFKRLCWVFVVAWAFSSCGEWGLLSSCGTRASHCAGVSSCGAQALGTQALVVVACGSAVVVPGLSCSLHVESSQTRDRTCVSCTGRQILNHWATWEAPSLLNIPNMLRLLCKEHLNAFKYYRNVSKIPWSVSGTCDLLNYTVLVLKDLRVSIVRHWTSFKQ